MTKIILEFLEIQLLEGWKYRLRHNEFLKL